jgi:iron-sulfur cluster assembly protein
MALIGIQSKATPKLKPTFEDLGPLESGQIGISERAASRLLALLANEKPGSFMRVGLQGGGCSGLKPYFAFVESAPEHDQLFTDKGVSICVDPRSLSAIGGSWLDFDGGFKIRSERFQRSCSCGESFSIK